MAFSLLASRRPGRVGYRSALLSAVTILAGCSATRITTAVDVLRIPYAPIRALPCELGSAVPNPVDERIVFGSGQFPVAVPAGGGTTVIAFRGHGAHVSLAGRIDFGVIDSTWRHMTRLIPYQLKNPLDDRSPALIAVAPWEWLLLYSELDPGGPGGTYDLDSATYRMMFSRTRDGGLTWSTPEPVRLPGVDSLLAIPYGKMRTLPDGTVLASIYAGQVNAGSWSAWRPVLLATQDGGTTWSVLSELPTSHSETAFLPVGGDTLLAAMRSGANQIQLAISPDLGGHWLAPVTVTDFNQVPADLAQLPDGEILLVYGSRADGAKGIYYRRIRRDGDSVAVSGPGRAASISVEGTDFGYPSIATIFPNGRVVVLYYISGPGIIGTTELRMVTFCAAVPPT